AMSYMRSNDLPAGHNAVVAIACYSGYNQEDSIIMSRSAVERGFFRSAFWRSYKATEERKKDVRETFENPDRNICRVKRADYTKLDADGLIKPGMPVMGGDILVGKTIPISEAKLENAAVNDTRLLKRDCSIASRTSEKGVVERVMLTENSGNRFTKVKIRTIKIPNIGDKFCSRHGQKGTNGIQFRQEDMPFNRDGIVPDLIINPHAIPSRMTVAHLIETLAGKVACYKGSEVYATPFCSVVVEDFGKALHQLKFQRYGNECLYNGHTGSPLDHLIFFGPTYYQRLKHLSGDKIHARPRGPLQPLVRQPTEGRAHEGGLRFGEMERDCMLSYGASQWLRERLFRVSDYYSVHVCNICGTICAADTEQNVYKCQGCDNDTRISQTLMPYACKLLFQELMSMAILPRLGTGPL
ncbi:putative DNA-directed RNA polymerase II subunit 2, partial [Trypanosoma cruzi]